jgi:hypothetical protein
VTTNRESWDDFKRRLSGRTEEICGVVVPVPTDVPWNFETRLADLQDSSEQKDIEELVAMLFGDDVFDQWVENGMGKVEMMTVLTWGMAQGNGKDITFSQAYDLCTSDDPGKALNQNRATRRAASKPRSATTGARSKRTSAASTGSARKTSRA